MIVGYKPGYRTDWDAAVGAVSGTVLSDNTRSWSGDHCMDPRQVPGVVFSPRCPSGDAAQPGGSGARRFWICWGWPAPGHMTGRSIFREDEQDNHPGDFVMRIGLGDPSALVAGQPWSAAATGPKVLVFGFDGMDPKLLEEFRAQGVMPNFEKFLAAGGQVTPFGTSTPPQSPVAWSNFITGMDPGGHGIFDFIHRDPETLLPFFSASEAKAATRFWKIGSWKIPRDGGEVLNLRKGTAFWELLTEPAWT